MKSSILRRVAVLPVLAGVLAGCADVKPWQRGNLAREVMALDPHPHLTAFRDHAFESKEASQGGHARTGGGCGCN